jgi:hypothetical protein
MAARPVVFVFCVLGFLSREGVRRLTSDTLGSIINFPSCWIRVVFVLFVGFLFFEPRRGARTDL